MNNFPSIYEIRNIKNNNTSPKQKNSSHLWSLPQKNTFKRNLPKF